MSWPLRAATTAVRMWTRAYTSGMPRDLREARRAEIDSDLWEFQHDRETSSHPLASLHVVGRLLRGVPDDVTWRIEHASTTGWSWTIRVTASTIGVFALLTAFWIYDGLSAPVLPPPPSLFVGTTEPPLLLPPPPPPPPPEKPRLGTEIRP